MLRRVALSCLLIGCGEPGAGSEVPDAPPSPIDGGASDAGNDAASTDASSDASAQLDAPTVDAGVQEIDLSSAYWSTGWLAITSTGLRATYRVDGVEQPSAIKFRVYLPDTQTFCYVRLRPAFVGFGTVVDSGRDVKTVRLDPGTGTVIENECALPDSALTSAFSTQMGTIQVGLIEADPGFYPRLDLITEGDVWGGPSFVTHSNFNAQAVGHAMDGSGNVDMETSVVPGENEVIDGLYEWLPI